MVVIGLFCGRLSLRYGNAGGTVLPRRLTLEREILVRENTRYGV